MIIRHIPMKKTRDSSFLRLIHYLCNQQNKIERVGKINIGNCNSVDPSWAIQEVLATQAKNQRAKGDKTYHMVISFAPGENPSSDALWEIEERVVSSIGLKEHQRISIVHHDTDNLHIHVAINKIHPKNCTMIEPFRAYKTFAEIAGRIEMEFNLEQTNHLTRKSRSENRADNMEHHLGIESLINWIKRHCNEQIMMANNWLEIHSLLAEHGLSMKIRANGLVFTNNKGLMVKASSVSRNFSKNSLELKLGEFIPSYFENKSYSSNVYRYEPLNKAQSSELYALYQHERTNNKTTLSDKLKQLQNAKSRLIEEAKKRNRLKRNALKLMSLSKWNKKYLYQQISKSLINDINRIRENYGTIRSSLIDIYQNKTWSDWLQQKAQEGNQIALTTLRYRNRKNKNDNTLSGAVLGTIGQMDSATKEVTKSDTLNKAVIREDDNKIKISKGGSIASLKKAIELAKLRYGNCIRVNGSPLFKKMVLQIVIQHQIKITFADLDMETEHQNPLLVQEKPYESARENGYNYGRRTSRSPETSRAAERNGRVKPKSNTFCFKQSPPSKNQNSLRNVSQLDVVQLPARGEMLLQNHAYDKLERQGFKPNHHVRR